MIDIRNVIILVAAIILNILPIFNLSAYSEETDDLLDLSFEELLEVSYVSIASGSLVPVEKAAAVATVITAKDIKMMGARDLDEVLETVPGLHVSNTFAFYNPIYSFRGIHTQANPQAHFLINGIPITSSHRSDRGGVWAGMPIKAISRIEVIRGPGSAIYGADAYAGVVNIITKKSTDILEDEVGIRFGSFSTRDGWVLKGAKVSDYEVAVMAEFFTSDDHDEQISIDAQTISDNLDSTNASFAPGPPNLSREGGDIRIDIRNNRWLLRAGYQNRGNVGTGAGGGESISPSSKYTSDRFNLDLTFRQKDFFPNLEYSATFSFLHINQDNQSNNILIPPGGLLAGAIPFEDGLIGNPNIWENNYRFDSHIFYTNYPGHKIRVGFGYYLGDLYRVRETKNFDQNFMPLPDIIEFEDTGEAFVPEETRENIYVSIQDEWKLSDHFIVTLGARFDHFTEFGDSTNPRVALVWNSSEKLTNKFL